MPKRKNKQKEQARHLYFNTAGTLREIAHTVGVHVNTLSRWLRDEDWAHRKAQVLYSPAQEAWQLYEELRCIDNNIRQRPLHQRHCTKEELEAKLSIIKMLTAIAANQPNDNWRNATPFYDLKQHNAEEDKIVRYFITGGEQVEMPLGGPYTFAEYEKRKQRRQQKLLAKLQEHILQGREQELSPEHQALLARYRQQYHQ